MQDQKQEVTECAVLMVKGGIDHMEQRGSCTSTVFAYKLNGSFSNGEEYYKSGNITLIQ